MNQDLVKDYQKNLLSSEIAYYSRSRALIAVWGREAVQFLNGLVTNDIGKLADGEQLRAAFPNAQGRLLAAVRVKRAGDKFLFETEAATREKVFQNLFRFTFAGDFFVEDWSDNYEYFEIQNSRSDFRHVEKIEFESDWTRDIFIPKTAADQFRDELKKQHFSDISDELYEVWRIERGIPLYGRDMDETTIVPELGIENLISYNKGCYIGQEIIARIHFRGHVAKQLRGLIFEDTETVVQPADELKSADGKNAGKITSVTFSPKLEKVIALAYVRYEFLGESTKLQSGDAVATVVKLPFFE